MSRRRVVITGVGPITAFGLGMDPLWQALGEGRSAVRRIRRFDPEGFGCRVGAELDAEAFDVRSVVPKSYRKATKVMARDIELAVGGAAAAVADAGLVTKATEGASPTISPARIGCHIGAGLIAAETDELTAALATSRHPDGSFDIGAWGRSGMNNLTPLWMLKYLPNMLACHVTIIHDCQGPSNTLTCAEASAGLSVGESVRVIERGDADACLSGGAESKLHLMGLLRQGFAARLVRGGDDAAQAAACRPFDPESGGTVLGEGGGILVLEAAETAAARGARGYAEVAGFGASQNIAADVAGISSEPDGESIAAAIEAALADAGLAPDRIDAIAPLGAGIVGCDLAERRAMEHVFGTRLPSIPIVTLVPALGCCCAGAGGVALAVAARCVRDQRLPARLNAVATPGLDAAAAPARDADIGAMLVFCTSFGGQNAALVLRRLA